MLQRDVFKSRLAVDPSAQALRQFICSEILNGRGVHAEIEPITERVFRPSGPVTEREPVTQRMGGRPCACDVQPCADEPCPTIIEMTSMGLALNFAPEGDLQLVELDEDDFEEIEQTSYGERDDGPRSTDVPSLPPIG